MVETVRADDFDGASMTGGIVPKLFALRWPIGIGVGLLLIAGVWLSSGSSRGSRGTSPLSAVSAFFTGDEYSSELRELGFLREALERIEAELQQKTNGPALASLRTEQEAVMQRTRQVASRVPVDRLPPDASRLIEPETASAPAPVTLAAPAAGAAPGLAAGIAGQSSDGAAPVSQREAGRAPGELHVGLAPPSPVADITSLARDTGSLWLLFIGPKEPRRAAPAPSDRPETRPSSAASLNRAEMRASSAVPADRPETRPSSR